MNNIEAQFGAAMAAYGLNPIEIIADGVRRRFDADDDKKGKKSAWYVLHADGVPAGAFGNWKADLSEKWCGKSDQALTPIEHTEYRARIEKAKQEAEFTRLQLAADAAKECIGILAKANDATDDNPYCVRKGIKPYGLKEFKDKRTLIVPIRNGAGIVTSLQFIDADGTKRFKSHGQIDGCYYSFGGKPVDTVLICEGFATGASLHQVTGYPVAVAFNAGNLGAVAKVLRGKLPDIRIIVCADNDRFNENGNIGVTKATAAALAAGGLLAVPDFGTDRPADATDFNDMTQLCGPDAVRLCIESALNSPPSAQNTRQDAITIDVDNSPAMGLPDVPDYAMEAMPLQYDLGPITPGVPSNPSFPIPIASSTAWSAPQPLATKVAPEPYPIDALPASIRAAVEEVAGFVKAPLPLVAASALAALSLAGQGHVDAKRADKLAGPVGLFLLTIADSGERKSTCDGFFTRAIRDYEEAQVEAAKQILKDHKAACEAWEAKRGGIKDKIRQLAKDNKPTTGMESALRDLEHDKPEAPRIPRLLYADATPEALAYGLAKHWPSGGVVSAEAGIVFGSHGMGKDSVMRNLGLLNQLWDGTSLTIDRRSTESFTVRGARLTVALQVQEPTLREFFSRSGALARGTGFLARFLVAWPESTQGFRPFTEAPAHWPHLSAFHQRIAAILNQDVPIDEDGALTPAMLSLTTDAKTDWVEFHDAIERELPSGGELYDVRDVASKSADNAVRLAALLHLFAGGGGAIGTEAFDGASRIAAWHLNEARRFFGELALPEELADAGRLDSWLIEYCRRERTDIVPIAKLQQGGPAGLRSKATIDAAMRELEEAGRARSVKDGKRKMIAVNPALLTERAAS